jgi:5-methyltetrahydropteroyltriglutamate--homocysteine methyltransferase
MTPSLQRRRRASRIRRPFAPITSAVSCDRRFLLRCARAVSHGRDRRSKLRAFEDEAIRGVVKFQEDLGLRGITDGEYRRTYFHIDFLTQLQGVQTRAASTSDSTAQKGDVDFEPPVMQVTGKVGTRADPARRLRIPALGDVAHAEGDDPVANDAAFRGVRDAISREAYPDLEAFYADVAAGYADELASLGAAGCTYVQFDDTNLAYLCDERMREGARQRGDDPTTCRDGTHISSTPRSPSGREA